MRPNCRNLRGYPRALSRGRTLLGVVAASVVAIATAPLAAAPLEFNRDIRPILSENCFQCHGQDASKREARLRLDQRDSATRDREGYAAIIPGKPTESEVVLRITSKDPDEVMPPPDSHKTLTPAQIEMLRRWIAEGAAYQKHWAFEPARRPELPAVRTAQWARNAIDRFVLSRLEREGLEPSREAAPETWLRRASLDLVGLPPTPAELDAFAADVGKRGEPAYGAAVDRLLASPHYGERQAIEWLDAARYADTHGFNNDSARVMWRWRDWVIASFNANLPYDRFITEQLAGDLLSQPTLEQRIATGFGRNHVINSEGGIIEEEYRVEYVADRVRTMSTAWLGLTLECARCHDHKFDPVTQADYYRMFAFFNNVPEHGEDGRVSNAVPMIPAPTTEQQNQLAAYERELAALDAQLAPHVGRVDKLVHAWTRREKENGKYNPVGGAESKEPQAGKAVPPGLRARVEAVIARARRETDSDPGVALLPEENVFDGHTVFGGAWWADTTPVMSPAPKIPPAKLDFAGKAGVTLAFWLRPDPENPDDVPLLSSLNYAGAAADAQYGKGRELRLINGELEVRMSSRFPVYSVIVRTEGANIRPGEWRHVAVVYAGGASAAAIRVFIDGGEVALVVHYDGLPAEPGKRDFLIGADNAKNGSRWLGTLDEMRSFPRALCSYEILAHFRSEALPLALAQLEESRNFSRTEIWLRDALLQDDTSTRRLLEQRAASWERQLAFRRSLPTAMVMQELPEPRPAFVLNRGQYDAHGERVDAGVPEALLAPWPSGAPRNRLGLARWLTQPQHPLTARVVANRIWAQLFGTGIVKTLEDFGSQGEWPVHPDLLDWLAREFVDHGWNVKALLKMMVLSATYRQDSAVMPDLLARDPENRLLARGPRVRLPAELIRDQALAVSGLLTPRIGGPSVFPYQPEKLYEGIVVGAEYPGTQWRVSTGEDLYRRSLYTFWKRTMTHPAMTSFDAPDREFCTVRRSRTNTPLQALTLWNEPGYFEAARQLGTRMLRDGGKDDRERVTFAFRRATGRRPGAKEIAVLVNALMRLREDFAAHPDDAANVLTVGASPVDESFSAAELAAATSVASMILSLDETVTKN